MKFLRYLLPLAVAACTVMLQARLYAVCGNEDQCTRQRDFEVVKEYLNTKRTMDLQEKSHNLTISGDVRAVWRHFSEKEDGRSVVGGSSVDRDGFPNSRNRFNADFDLYLDYVCDRAWSVVWLEFLNRAGIEESGTSCDTDPGRCGGSGTCEQLCLKSAYMGYNVCCDGENRFDVELGRRPLWTIFDSRIQFQSRFDGLLLKYSTGFDCWGDFYINGGGFVIDQRTNHFGYVVETGFLNIMDWGFDFKYSYINWPKTGHGRNSCLVKNPRGWQFRNSQWTFAYNFNPELLCTPASVYGAVLWNHAAKKRVETRNKKRGLGWYVGFIVGEVVQEGDWALDIDYEVVQAQAVNDCDVSGIGRGNLLGESFILNGRGNANYKGWRFEGLYALTDNLTLDTILEFSRANDKNIGDRHTFSKLELQAIYAF